MLINETSKRIIYFRPHDARTLGEGCYYLDHIVWLNGSEIELGHGVGFNIGCYVNGYGGLTIGDRTGFGPYCMIHTANHATNDPDIPILDQPSVKEPVRIGKHCWIGMGACILPGVTIGDGAIIGAGSVVTRDVPPYVVAAGNPCRVIRSRKPVGGSP